LEEIVPLSEEELRLLEQMERALAQEDPKFVSALQGRSLQRNNRIRTVAAAGVFLCGVALLMGGAVAQMTWLGILGFVVMLASAVVGLTSWRGRQAHASEPTGSDALFDFNDNGHPFSVIQGGKSGRRPKTPRARKTHSHGTFMQRMEQRWQRRRDRGY
jgi:hypothetical protein